MFNSICPIPYISNHRGFFCKWYSINSLRPTLNRRPFTDDIFKCIFLNENEWILPRISLKFVPKVQLNNIPALVQIMAWRRPGDKPLSEPMMVSLLTHICVTRPQWVKCMKHRVVRHTWMCVQHQNPECYIHAQSPRNLLCYWTCSNFDNKLGSIATDTGAAIHTNSVIKWLMHLKGY